MKWLLKPKKYFWLLILTILGIAVAVLLSLKSPWQIVSDLNNVKHELEDNYQNSHQPPPVNAPEQVLLDVPFFAQAPTAKWSDPRQQDGCEEASIIMAYLWATGKSFTVQQAEQEIIAMSEFEKERYGGFVDRSITDTGKLFSDYYNFDNYAISRNITAEDIKQELSQGHLVVVPTNGQILANPNYTGEGPVTHMLPIIGYDDKTQEFITNDPGTRNGRRYRFTYDVMLRSIYDYETGAHEGYQKTDTVMMVVTKTGG